LEQEMEPRPSGSGVTVVGTLALKRDHDPRSRNGVEIGRDGGVRCSFPFRGGNAMDGSEARPSPAPIIQMASAYWASSVLLTANRIGLFTAVGAAAMTGAEIAAKLALPAYPLDNFLGAPVS